MNIEHVIKYPEGERKERPILLVPGAWHSASCYDLWLEEFAAHGYETHAISFPGHGQSSLTRRTIHLYGIADYMQVLKTAIDQITPTPFVIAHSMGGYTLQRYLQRHELPGAVLLASVPHSGAFSCYWRFARILPITHIGRILRFDLRGFINRPDTVKYLVTRSAAYTPEEVLSRLSNESMRAGINLLVPIRGKPTNTPILVVAGEHDHLFSVEEEQHTAEFYNAEFILAKGQGHDLMMDGGWRETAALIREWLEHVGKGNLFDEQKRTA